jgi:hypothetical protein
MSKESIEALGVAAMEAIEVWKNRALYAEKAVKFLNSELTQLRLRVDDLEAENARLKDDNKRQFDRIMRGNG